jgi:hypothetical protein
MTKSCYYCLNKPKKAPLGYNSIWCKIHYDPKKSINASSIRCKIQNCKKVPKYGYAGDKIAKLCYLHTEIGMIDITATICIYQTCQRKSIAGGIDNIPKYCKTHATLNANIQVQRCAYITCRNIPNKKYKFIFCDDHFIHGNADTCLLCTNLVSEGLYCNECNIDINNETTNLFDNIDIAAAEYRLVPNTKQQIIDPLLKQEIDFSIKLDHVPFQLLINELDLLDKKNNTFDFITGIQEIAYEPYVIHDHIDIPDI